MAVNETFISYTIRTLTALVGAAGTAVLVLVWLDLGDVKATQEKTATQVWKTLSEVTKSEADISQSLAKVTTTLADHIGTETIINEGLKDEEKDHEQRLRSLERSPPAH